ncbi:chromate transporter [Acidocella aromatica]|uniref:Chromate transporter n=1 Tax=Acidocella aromatica TaxID=1303579 RepID=A0A840V8L3_9PROT|nr:chromate transporter [Acidocella aromatica]MBB5372053.1 chromate transporter [Acidocella aromatica]
MNILAQLALLFGKLSLVAVGGANATVPEIARQVVTLRHWLSPVQFAQLYAISNAAPGPNVMIATVIGAHVAGVPGGIVATLAMILPSGLLAILVSKGFERHAGARWQKLAKAALLPITAGLVLAAALVLTVQSVSGWLTACIALGCAVLSWCSRLHPLWLLGGGAVLGMLIL